MANDSGVLQADGRADARLPATLLLRAAQRQGTAATSTLLGVALVAYAHWDGPGWVIVPWFVLARLAALAWSHLLSRRILRLQSRGEPFMHLEWQFVLAMGAGGAAWGFIGWMVPDLNLANWMARDVFSAIILVFISCMMLITLSHHGRALQAHVCAQWAFASLYMWLTPGPLAKSLLIFVGILGLVAVLLLYGRLLQRQTRAGVLAELRNEDLTERLQQANRQLERALEQAVTAANHDPLTGLLNRRALHARVEQLSAARRRHGGACSVLLLDVDHFKRVNDGHGHAAGDEVLRALAATLSRALREVDVIARWGGEEFLVVMPDCDIQAALARAEQVRDSVTRLAVAALPAGYALSISIGAADWPIGTELNTVVSRADAALYRAKEAGRNRVELAPP